MANNNCGITGPLCSTFVFFCGVMLGAYAEHTGTITHDIIVIGVATGVFFLTQVMPTKLALKKIK